MAMIVVVTAALFGAALGLLMRNRVLAVVLSVLTVGVVQLGMQFVVGMMSHNQRYAFLGETLSGYFGKDLWAAAPGLAAAGAGSVLAAMMLMLMRLDQRDHVSLPGEEGGLPRIRERNGKLRRAPGMIEERSIHEAAESRIDRLMKL